MILDLVLVIFSLSVFLFFMDWLTFVLRGDCDLYVDAARIQNCFKMPQEDSLFLSFDIPFVNRSRKEQALVIFGDLQSVPERKEDQDRERCVKLTLAENPRKDGYFEAFIVKPKKSVFARALIQVSPEDVRALNHLNFLLSYGYYGRTPLKTERLLFSVPLAQFKENENAFKKPVSSEPLKKTGKPNVVPIRTHLIFPGEDWVKIVRQYLDGKAEPGDWVVISESVAAIAQNRVYPVTSIFPGFWAKRLNRFFQFNSSLASCYSMQKAIEEVGLPRMMAGVLIGLAGRLVGRTGDFYRIAGRQAATIDDCTGTLPPFDKSVVMGPLNPGQLALRIREETGLEAAVVDANDLGKVDILGKSSGIEDQQLVEAVVDNPQGNSDEQTPLVWIKKRPSAEQRAPLEGEK
jgi:hypothetical protein